ncbi:methicillin resistance protein [Ktedonobacteria bacterium brp13]|nr:methicillin resistance protein [Ktedonobacteria bacterium brp13]
MAITVQEIHDREQWDAFLLRQPHGHFLQSYEWGELHDKLGERIYRLGALEDGQLVGVMMLVVSTISLPLPKIKPTWLYCGRGPVLARPDPLILLRLLSYIAGIAQQHHAVMLRVEPNIADDDPDLDIWLAVYHKAGFGRNPHSIHGRRSWVLDIRPPMDRLRAQFKPLWRQNISLAEQYGMHVRVTYSATDFEIYYHLLQQHSNREGLFLHSKEYHWLLYSSFVVNPGTRDTMWAHDAVILQIVYHGRVIAAKMLLRFGDWCWDMYSASADPADLTEVVEYSLVDYLLQYYALCWAQDQGCRYFDFRSIPEVLMPGEDLWDEYEYKKGFGGFSRLNMLTQDYVYQPLIYKPWRALAELKHEPRHRHAERQSSELGRFTTELPERAEQVEPRTGD